MMRRLGTVCDAIGAAALGGLLMTAGACSDTTSDAGSGSSLDAEGDAANADGSTGGEADQDGLSSAGFGSTGGGDDESGGSGDGGDGSTGGDPGGRNPAPNVGSYDTCPEPLPEGWIFCEDFEAVLDPSTVFFDYVDADGNFAPCADGGASGVGSMKAHYREGVEGAGFMSVSFGNNPIQTAGRPGYKDSDTFDEVYWRFRVKMQQGWPDAGPFHLSRISALAQSDWGEAMVASIASDDAKVNLRASAASCVQGDQVACAGIDDGDALVPLGTLSGSTPVFSAARAGTWQCVEAHVKLNSPGNADGMFEFWVDGELEAGRTGMDWRGSWEAFGLNLLSIENFWVGGAPADLDRWFDDIVISTEPIGCD